MDSPDLRNFNDNITSRASDDGTRGNLFEITGRASGRCVGLVYVTGSSTASWSLLDQRDRKGGLIKAGTEKFDEFTLNHINNKYVILINQLMLTSCALILSLVPVDSAIENTDDQGSFVTVADTVGPQP